MEGKWNEVPLYLKYGIYCKKELVEDEKVIKEKIIHFKRGKIFYKTFKIKFSVPMLKLLLCKYWSDIKTDLIMEDYN